MTPNVIHEDAGALVGAGRGLVASEAADIWSENLTDAQLKMLMASGENHGCGYGVELSGSAWITARNLVRLGLGWIEGDPGGELPGLFFNNGEGVRILHEFDDEDDGHGECPLCGGS